MSKEKSKRYFPIWEDKNGPWQWRRVAITTKAFAGVDLNGLGRQLDPSSDPLAYQAEMGALWERPAQELALAKGPPPASGRNILGGGPLSLVIRVSTPGRPQLSPASFARGNQVPRGLAGYGCASLGPVDSDFRAVIVVGLGSLVGREA